MSRLKLALILVMSIGLWQVAAAATDTGTLVVGWAPPFGTIGCSVAPFPYLSLESGFLASAFGSYSPTGLTGGETVDNIIDFNPYCGGGSWVRISGFSANPGKNWLTSVTCGGVTETAGNATSYFYGSAGDAEWLWPTDFGFAFMFAGTSVSCTIVHN